VVNLKYKYIEFKLIKRKPKTEVWGIYNIRDGYLLGEIKWDIGWRQYTFYPENAKFSESCLIDVLDFLKQIKTEYKKGFAGIY